MVEEDYGNYCKESERRAEAEVQQPQAQPVPALRKAERFSAQVWRVPSVLPDAGAQGGNPRRREVELVRTQDQGTVDSDQLILAETGC